MNIVPLKEMRAKCCEAFPLDLQAMEPDPMICAVLYWPNGITHGYVTGCNPAAWAAYGFVSGVGSDEWGYFSALLLF